MIFLFHIMSVMYSSEDIKADHAPTIAERVHEKKRTHKRTRQVTAE